MAHEMVHAYDHLRFKVNWTDNLRHAACTEVCSQFGSNAGSSIELIYDRFELVRSAANADGHASFSGEANGSLPNNIRNVSDEELFCRLERGRIAETRLMHNKL